MNESEGYWDESAVQQTSKNFFEDESSTTKMCGVSLGGTAKLSQQIKAGLGGIGSDRYSGDSLSGSLSGLVLKGTEDKVDLDLHQLIPERTLQKIMDADSEDFSFLTHSLTTEKEELHMLRRYYEGRWSPPEINSIVVASLLGRPYSLEQYKSLKHKKELLKAAEMIGDGDLILNVILFLNRTLKKKLFHDILAGTPIGIQHYTNYLSTTKQTSVLTDTLEMLGRSREAAMKLYSEACTNPQRMLQRLRVCSRNHFTETKDKIVLDNFIKLLEWQETYDGGKLLGASVATCLSDLCLNHWDLPRTSPNCPLTFYQSQGATDRLYQWAALNARGKRQAWADIDAIFLTKGWLGGKKAKTDLPMEEVVSCMSKLGAAQTLLSSYLEFVDNLDKRLALAKKLQCHRSAIDTFIAQKDRLSLLNYKANLMPQSEDYIYAEQSLRNPYSDDEYKPPVSYLQRRRNAICVTSLSADKETPAGTTHVLSFLSKRGIIPPMRRSKNEEDLDISSDDSDHNIKKLPKELKKNASIQVPLLHPTDPGKPEQYLVDGGRKQLRPGGFQMPGFLRSQQKVNLISEAPPSTAKDMSTAIGKMSLLSNRAPKQEKMGQTKMTDAEWLKEREAKRNRLSWSTKR